MQARWLRLLLDPNAVDGGGGSPAEPMAGSSAPPVESNADLPSFNPGPAEGTPAPSSATPPPTGTPPSQAQAPAGSAAAEWQSIREAAGRFGYQFGNGVTDDESALIHLVQQAQRAQQADVYSQLGRQLAPHAQQIQGYLQQQAQPTASPGYTPPPFDQRWLGLVERDPASGMVIGKPGTPPAIVDAVNKRIEWQDRFQNDPVAMFEEYAKEKFAPTIAQTVQAELAKYQQQQAVQNILSTNADWLYQKDQNGAYLRGPNGYVATPQGQRYAQHVETLSRSGVTDPRIQDQLARQLVFGEIAMGQARQSTAPPTQAVARGNVNPLQARPSTERLATPGATEPSNEGLSLFEMMKRDADQAGLTEADFAM